MTFYPLQVKLLRFMCQYVCVNGAKMSFKERANELLGANDIKVTAANGVVPVICFAFWLKFKY